MKIQSLSVTLIEIIHNDLHFEYDLVADTLDIILPMYPNISDLEKIIELSKEAKRRIGK